MPRPSASGTPTAKAEVHACRGLNACKGQGAGGDNACAGQGACATTAALDGDQFMLGEGALDTHVVRLHGCMLLRCRLLHDLACSFGMLESSTLRRQVTIAEMLSGAVDAYQGEINAHYGLSVRP